MLKQQLLPLKCVFFTHANYSLTYPSACVARDTVLTARLVKEDIAATFFLLANSLNTLPLINRFTSICLRTRNEFLRGSPSLVELEQRYCFFWTSVNPDELSPFYWEGQNKTKTQASKLSLSNCQSRALKIVGSLESRKRWCLSNLSLAENLKVISLHYMQILYGIYVTHLRQTHRPHKCVRKCVIHWWAGFSFFLPMSCLLGIKF